MGVDTAQVFWYTELIMGANKGAEKAAKLQAQVAQQSLDLQKLSLAQPKVTTPDNFAANKLKTLNTLRLGLASTITAPAVNSMKTKLGV